ESRGSGEVSRGALSCTPLPGGLGRMAAAAYRGDPPVSGDADCQSGGTWGDGRARRLLATHHHTGGAWGGGARGTQTAPGAAADAAATSGPPGGGGGQPGRGRVCCPHGGRSAGDRGGPRRSAV